MTFLVALKSGKASLALSIVHLIELADPNFISAPAVREFLDRVPVVWCTTPDDLWFAELNAAFGRYVGIHDPVVPFVHDVNVMLGGNPLGAPPSRALEAFEDPKLRARIAVLRDRGMAFEALKRDALIVREPEFLLKRMINQRLPRNTPAGIVLPAPIDAGEFLRATGGIEGLPSYSLMHKVANSRLRDTSFVAKPSDVFDLMHVGYSVYASFTALERSHAARVRSARPSLSDRVVHRLDKVTEWLRCRAV